MNVALIPFPRNGVAMTDQPDRPVFPMPAQPLLLRCARELATEIVALEQLNRSEKQITLLAHLIFRGLETFIRSLSEGADEQDNKVDRIREAVARMSDASGDTSK